MSLPVFPVSFPSVICSPSLSCKRYENVQNIYRLCSRSIELVVQILSSHQSTGSHKDIYFFPNEYVDLISR